MSGSSVSPADAPTSMRATGWVASASAGRRTAQRAGSLVCVRRRTMMPANSSARSVTAQRNEVGSGAEPSSRRIAGWVGAWPAAAGPGTTIRDRPALRRRRAVHTGESGPRPPRRRSACSSPPSPRAARGRPSRCGCVRWVCGSLRCLRPEHKQKGPVVESGGRHICWPVGLVS